jgi:hypothetical protein
MGSLLAGAEAAGGEGDYDAGAGGCSGRVLKCGGDADTEYVEWSGGAHSSDGEAEANRSSGDVSKEGEPEGGDD